MYSAAPTGHFHVRLSIGVAMVLNRLHFGVGFQVSVDPVVSSLKGFDRVTSHDFLPQERERFFNRNSASVLHFRKGLSLGESAETCLVFLGGGGALTTTDGRFGGNECPKRETAAAENFIVRKEGKGPLNMDGIGRGESEGEVSGPVGGSRHKISIMSL